MIRPEDAGGTIVEARKNILAMSKGKPQTLLDQLNDDGDPQEKLKGAVSLDDAVAIANSLEVDASKADWLTNKRLIGPHWLWKWDRI